MRSLCTWRSGSTWLCAAMNGAAVTAQLNESHCRWCLSRWFTCCCTSLAFVPSGSSGSFWLRPTYKLVSGLAILLAGAGLRLHFGLCDSDLHCTSLGLYCLRAVSSGWWIWQRPDWSWKGALQAPLMGSDLEELRREVEVLKEDYRSLEAEVRRLRRAFAGLRAPENPAGYPESEGSFSFLEGSVARGSVAPSSPARSVDSSGIRSVSASLTSGVPAAATAGLPLSWARREEIADGIGLWARRSLGGENRGTKNPCRADCGLSSNRLRVRPTTRPWSTRTGQVQRPWWSEGLRQGARYSWEYPRREKLSVLWGSQAWIGLGPIFNDWCRGG